MITKVIHYCWFGKGEMPEKSKECIQSWRKHFSDYEVKEWNEDNFDLNSCDFVREAYAAKKWAFVSDYARFSILYTHGGMYFDTDVEVIKPFDDIIKNGSFMGFEQGKQTAQGVEYEINPGLGLGATPGLAIFKEILDYYHTIHFTYQDGGHNLTTIVRYTTDVLKKHGMENSPEIQQIAGLTLYPPDYFSPLNFNTGIMNLTENTHSIHHFLATWFSKWDWIIVKIERRFSSRSRFKYFVGQLLMLPFKLIRKIRNVGLMATVKLVFRKLFKH